MTDSTGSPQDARIAAARERVLADARRARRVGDQVAVRFDPRRGERDPTFDLDALGVQYTVTLISSAARQAIKQAVAAIQLPSPPVAPPVVWSIQPGKPDTRGVTAPARGVVELRPRYAPEPADRAAGAARQGPGGTRRLDRSGTAGSRWAGLGPAAVARMERPRGS